MSSVKTYSAAHPGLKIVQLPGEMGGPKSRMIEFVNGFYTTSDPGEQSTIETSHFWKRGLVAVIDEKPLRPAVKTAAEGPEAEVPEPPTTPPAPPAIKRRPPPPPPRKK